MREITGYPQMPPLTDAELDELLAGPHLARLSTIDADGTPHTLPIWYEWRDRQIHVSTQSHQRKVDNIRRDPRVTVLVDTDDWPYRGAMIRGVATLDRDDAVTKRVSIFERYVGSREAAVAAARGLASKWEPVVIHIEPTEIVSFDYAKGSFQPLTAPSG